MLLKKYKSAGRKDKVRLIFALLFLIHYVAFSQQKLEVVLQKGHTNAANYNSIPGVKAVSNDNRWVITSDKAEHTLIIWEIKIGKIYATYPITAEITDAVFLVNNEDVLINKAFILNIHTGKITREFPVRKPAGFRLDIRTDFTPQFHNFVYNIIRKTGTSDSLELQYKGYTRSFCYNNSSTIFWGFNHDRVYEYDSMSGAVKRDFDPKVGQINRIAYDPLNDLLIIEGQERSGFFKTSRDADFQYLPLTALNFSSDRSYASGVTIAAGKDSSKLEIWKLDASPKLIYNGALEGRRHAVLAYFIDKSSKAIIYLTGSKPGIYRAKVIDLDTKQVLWEDPDEADYILSQNGNYLIASYGYGNVRAYNTQTFKWINQDPAKQIFKVQVSRDENYLLQSEGSIHDLGNRVALYRLPGFEQIDAEIKDSLHKADNPGQVISADSKEIFFYAGDSKLIGRFSISKQAMEKDSLPLPVFSYGSLDFSSDGLYLISSKYGEKPAIYDLKFLHQKAEKNYKEVVRFTTPKVSKIFTLYQAADNDYLVEAQNVSDSRIFKYNIANFLLAFNTDKSGDMIAWCVPKVSGYQNVHRVFIADITHGAVRDSLDLPATETDFEGVLCFNNDASKLYIGWNNLYEYTMKGNNLRKIPVTAGTKFYPVNESQNGKFLFTYSPTSGSAPANLAVIDLSPAKIVLQSPSRLFSYLLTDQSNSNMKGYPELFETLQNLNSCYATSRDTTPTLFGPVGFKMGPLALTPDFTKQLYVTPFYGLQIYDSRTFKLLNTIAPAKYGTIGFTENRKFAVQYESLGIGNTLNIFDVQKGFKKIPFIYTTGAEGEYRFFDDRPVYNYETMLLSPKGTYLATIDSYGEGAVDIYDFAKGKLIYKVAAPYLSHKSQKETKDGQGNVIPDPLTHLSISSNEKYALFETYEGYMIKCDFKNSRQQRLIYAPKYLYQTDISSSGNWVAAISGDGNYFLTVWDSTANPTRQAIALNNDDLNALTIRIYEKQSLLGLRKADGIYFYELKTLKLVNQFIDPGVVTEENDNTNQLRVTFGNKASSTYDLPGFTISKTIYHSPDYSFTTDGEFQYIRKDTALVAKFIFDATNEQIMWFTPGNYYFVNKASKDAIAFKTNHNLYPASVFDAIYNRPDTVFSMLKPVFNFNNALLNVYHLAYLSRLNEKKGNAGVGTRFEKLPKIQIMSFASDINTVGKSFKVQIVAADSLSGINSYNILINGVPYFGTNGCRVNKTAFATQLTLPLLPGKNIIEAIATNTAGLSSLPSIITAYLTDSISFKPKTYFIGIGLSAYKNSDYDLRYAAKDIRDITSALYQKNKQLIIDTFLNSAVTRANILGLRNMLLRTNPEDKIICYYCGHGVRKINYYIGTYDFSLDDPAKDGLDINEIYKLLDSIPARSKLIILDACNSGQYYGKAAGQPDTLKGYAGRHLDANVKLVGRGVTVLQDSASVSLTDVMDDVFADFGNNYGIDVLAGTKGAELAYETPQLKNGVFTHAVLQALNTNLDGAYAHKPVPVSQFKNYVIALVTKLTGGLQTPVSRNENTEMDWVLW